MIGLMSGLAIALSLARFQAALAVDPPGCAGDVGRLERPIGHYLTRCDQSHSKVCWRLQLEHPPLGILMAEGLRPRCSSAFSVMAFIFGTNFNDVITPGGVSAGVVGGLPTNGVDQIEGRAGRDTIAAGGGDDTLLGGKGRDFLDGGFGFDVINGGAGRDTTTYAFFAGPIEANLQTGVVAFPGNSLLTDTLISIENIIGTNAADVITGSVSRNTINGSGGGDVIRGGAGRDRLTGGAGADQFVIGERGLANRDIITDFTPGVDDIVLKDSLDNGLPGAVAGGIQLLTFAGGNIAGNPLQTFFSKAPGSGGIGIGVDTNNGNVYYNPTIGQPGDTQIIAKVSLSAAAAMTANDFVFGA